MEKESSMSFPLGLRTLAHTLAILALVAVSTAVLVKPELIGGSGAGVTTALSTIPVLGHH